MTQNYSQYNQAESVFKEITMQFKSSVGADIQTSEVLIKKKTHLVMSEWENHFI